MEYALEYVHFCIEDNNVLVTAAYVEVLKEGESQLKLKARGVPKHSPFGGRRALSPFDELLLLNKNFTENTVTISLAAWLTFD